MDKILSDHRKQMGNFEFLDFVDEKDVAALREKLSFDAPVDVTWTWDYGSEVAELRQLYEKGKTAQWNATTDLDWDVPVTREDWVIKPEVSLLANVCKLMGKDEATQKAAAYDELNYLLSQLLHGEQAALQLCGQLTNVCDKMDQKFYAASQTIDEARHVEVMSNFLAQQARHDLPRLGGDPQGSARHAAARPRACRRRSSACRPSSRAWRSGIMDLLRTREPATRFLQRDASARVEQDEARHAAFGVLQHAPHRPKQVEPRRR